MPRTGQEEATGSIPQGLPDVIQSAGVDALLCASPAPTWNSLPFDQVPAYFGNYNANYCYGDIFTLAYSF
jgi:hypothetical protein